MPMTFAKHFIYSYDIYFILFSVRLFFLCFVVFRRLYGQKQMDIGRRTHQMSPSTFVLSLMYEYEGKNQKQHGPRYHGLV